MANRWGNNGNSDRFFSWAPKSLWTVTTTEIKTLLLLGKKSYDKPRQHIKKQRHHFANKVCIVKAMICPVVIYGSELNRKEGWTPKNWSFWTVVLEKTLDSPLDWKKIKPVSPKGDQPWIFIGRTDAEPEALTFWSPKVNLTRWKTP